MNPIPLFKVYMPPTVDDVMSKMLHSGYIAEGDYVKLFERRLQKFMFNEKILTTNSCTSALHLCLKLAGVEVGDAVITTSMTCLATNVSITNMGATPIWADVDPEHGMLTADTVEQALKYAGATLPGSKVKAVIHVCWGGDLGPIEEVYEVCKKYGVKLIIDAAQAFGARYNLGQNILGDGTCGDYVCFRGTAGITTDQGTMRIDNVKVGTRVLTEDGKYHPVLKVHKNKYRGDWVFFKAGQKGFTATENHPVKVYRDGKDVWIPAKDVKDGDSVYVTTKVCPDCKENKIPIYGQCCLSCCAERNISEKKRRKLHDAKQKSFRQTSRLIHHNKYVLPEMLKYQANGYRVIPLVKVIPDFLAIKDSKITAVEVESKAGINYTRKDKYEKTVEYPYDDVVWITQPLKRISKRYQYEIIGDFARVKVSFIKHKHNTKEYPVYNLTVDENSTYCAQGILVHNCLSFQAIKHITTGDGGAIAFANDDDYKRAYKLKWFGIDRDGFRTPNGEINWTSDVPEIGYKFHMNNIAGVIGAEQLNPETNFLSRLYQYVANDVILSDAIEEIKVPMTRTWRKGTAAWVSTFLAPDPIALLDFLKTKNIHASQMHVNNDVYTGFKGAQKACELVGVQEFMNHHICIPCGWWLTNEEGDYIIQSIAEFYNQ